MKTYESPLQEAAERFPQTLLWNDSCGVADLNLALRHGATGATSNPVIVGNVLRKEMADWKDRLNALIHVEMPDATDEEICWALSKEAALKGSTGSGCCCWPPAASGDSPAACTACRPS